MKYLIFTFIFLAIAISQTTAQNVDSTTVFGYAVPKPKLDSNGNPKHTFKPAFKRLGFTTGALFPLNGSEVGGTSGFRFEYGLSNKTSILLDFQGNNSRDSTFSAGQASLLVRSMPFKARRLQPYFGAGWSIGGGQTGRGNGRGRDRFTTTLDNEKDNDGTVKNYAIVQTGLNYILFRRVIASVEGNYQLQIGGTSAQKYGGASAKLGLAYQFGKRK